LLRRTIMSGSSENRCIRLEGVPPHITFISISQSSCHIYSRQRK
jgi:hypothetical protein